MNGGRELQRIRTFHVFAGAGGGILGDVLLGHHPVCAVEIDEYCQQVLSARQKDGCIPWFPIFADVKEFDGKPWRGLVDCVCGGFPCQDISPAGKGAGITGARSGLWSEMARIIREVGPRYVFVENSAMLTLRGLDVVLGDLASMGYDAEWCVLGADDAGAPHIRKRIWILADASQHGRLARGPGNAEEIEERREPDRGRVDAHVADASRILKGRSRSNGPSGNELGRAVNRSMLPTPTANRRDGLQSHGVNVVSGSLNPQFVEWLMNWPLGMTSLDSMPASIWAAWFRKSRPASTG